MILGAQFYTLREQCKDLKGFEESMKKVADIGYTSIQLSGVCAHEPEWAYEKARENGLSIDVTHYDLNKMCNETQATIAHHDALHCSHIGLGSSPYPKTEEGLEKLCERLAPVVKEFAAHGKKFAYHNHHWEFFRHGDKTFLDNLCERFSPDELAVILDVFWVQAAGGDPVVWIKKLKGRLDRVHFKDMKIFLHDDIYNMDCRRIASIGEGIMNYDAIIEACLDANAGIGYVELDDCYGEDPFECLKRSYKFLSERYGLK